MQKGLVRGSQVEGTGKTLESLAVQVAREQLWSNSLQSSFIGLQSATLCILIWK